MEPDLFARHYFQAPLPTFASGTQVAVVEVDGATGDVKILDYVSVSDAGPRINPTVVDGQIQGGIAQGLGGALMEEIYYDEEAQPLGSFLDYAIPRATDIPDVRQDHLETPSPLNPLGVKGLGEGGTLAPPAVLAASGRGRAGAAGRGGHANAADGRQRLAADPGREDRRLGIPLPRANERGDGSCTRSPAPVAARRGSGR